MHLSYDSLPLTQRTATVKLMRLTGRRSVCAVAVLLCALSAACARGKEYPLQGQILAVDQARQEITVKHGDIQGFMPGMTMAFKVREGVAGRTPGELIRATLVVEETSAYLKAVEGTGRAPLAEKPPPPRIDPIEPGTEVPDVALLDTAGGVKHLTDWKGHPLAVTFIYTRCPLPD